MKLLRKIFSLNTVILLGAFAFLYMTIGGIVEAFYDKKNLQAHEGSLLAKEIKVKKHDETEREYMVLTLSNGKEYIASKRVLYINRNLSIGDSVKLFTKPQSLLLSNFVSDDRGTSIWTTKNPNEVYELIDGKNSKVIDFEEHKRNLRSMLWLPPLFSVAFLGWFFYRRSGMKSPYIIETYD